MGVMYNMVEWEGDRPWIGEDMGESMDYDFFGYEMVRNIYKDNYESG